MNTMPPSASAAYRVAKEAFPKLDIADACRRTGARYDEAAGRYLLPYLGQTARVDAQNCDTQWERPELVSHMDTMVAWHYLMHADGTMPAGEKLSVYDAAPPSSGWAPRMLKHCVPPLAEAFGRDLPAFFASAEKIGGKKTDGNTAEFLFLPHLPVWLTLWEEDDEFPADARFLFDTSLPRQLPQEDLLGIPELLAYTLLQVSGKPFSMPGIGEFRPAR